jgi:ring-1,2-phenylacetyl-CoA epoxidase subunit PaaD
MNTISEKPTIDFIWQLMHQIPDPEIPVIDIVELGVVRNIEYSIDSLQITLSPTYSGCPAMKQMEDDVLKKLQENGLKNIEIKTSYNPPWTTDWITDEAKEKLFAYGISPPEHSSLSKAELMGHKKTVVCPQCKSKNTSLVSQFGSTACKALYKCLDCLEPFDYFKCI